MIPILASVCFICAALTMVAAVVVADPFGQWLKIRSAERARLSGDF